jgi:hypothetical protein
MKISEERSKEIVNIGSNLLLTPTGVPDQLSSNIWIPVINKGPRVKFKGGVVTPWSPRADDSFGVLTGPTQASAETWIWGLDLDIGDSDGWLGGDGLNELSSYVDSINESLNFDTLTIKTSSGGLHFIFRLEENKWVQGGQGHKILGSHIDVRGGRINEDGTVGGTGYLRSVPTPGYEIIKNAAIKAAPEWLYEVVRFKSRKINRTKKMTATDPLSKLVAKSINNGNRADAYVKGAVQGLTDELEGLWEEKVGWHLTALKVTASLAGLIENDLLPFTEEDAWKVMESWAEKMDDGNGFYEKHLEPAFLTKLGVDTPTSLPEDLEESLLKVDQSEKTEIGDISEFLGENINIDPPTWLLKHWLVGGQINSLTGAQKSTKSTLAGMLGALVNAKVAWISKDGEHIGTTKDRLVASGVPQSDFIIIPDDRTNSLPDLFKAVEISAGFVGTNGLIIIDSMSGVSRLLGKDEYQQSLVRDLWNTVLRVADGCTLLVIAHGSARDTSNILKGSEAFGQLVSHLLLVTNIEGTVTVIVPYSRYMAGSVRLAAGRLPNLEDYGDVVTPVLLDYKITDSGTMYVSERSGGLDVLINQIKNTLPLDGEKECSDTEWVEELGLTQSVLLEAEACGLLVKNRLKNGKSTLEYTGYYQSLIESKDEGAEYNWE